MAKAARQPETYEAADIESREEVRTILSEVNSLVPTDTTKYLVTTPAQFTAAGQSLQDCKAAIRRLEDVRVSLTQPINAALKKINAFFAEPVSRLKATEIVIKQNMLTYTTEQERIRAAEQKRLDEVAAVERRKREAEAEAARKRARDAAEKLEREAAAKREAEAKARREAEAAERKAAEARTAKARETAAAQAAEARAIEQAAKGAAERLDARAESRVERAEAKAELIEQQAAAVQAPAVVTKAPEVEGISYRTTWHAEVTDLMALVKAVAAGKVPVRMLMVDNAVLRSTATAVKDNVDIPGVRVWSEKSVVSRGA